MKYGMTFKVDLYDFNDEKGEELTTRPGDYLQMQLWRNKHIAKMPDDAADIYNNYALIYFALKREGRLAEYGIADEPLTIEAIDDMATRLSVYAEHMKADSLPMRAQTK